MTADDTPDRETDDTPDRETDDTPDRETDDTPDRESNDAPGRETILERLRRVRFGEAVACVQCGEADVVRRGTTAKGARRYFCAACERSFNDLTGTAFADHHFTVEELCYVVRMRGDRSTAQIARDIGRNYEPVLNVVHAIRAAALPLSAICGDEDADRPTGQ